jgi:hypothetical protein
MREIRLSSSEGGGADIRSPYPYFIDAKAQNFPFLFFSGAAECGRWDHISGRTAEAQKE